MTKPKIKMLWRRGVQSLFVLMTLYIGIQFIRFVNSISDPSATQIIARPAGVEAFLPISALIALKAWLTNGVFDSIHPAGLVIFLAAISLSLVFKRSFCSWVCPIGTLSEGLAFIGEKGFRRNLIPPRWLDNILRSLKYLILGFFVLFIFVFMDGAAAYAFLQTPYNMIADIKMLDFFREITGVGITVLLVLIVLSIFIRNFWCRYLCPYGALLGLFGMISPYKIRRDTSSCTSCKQCSGACPNRIQVDKAVNVWSPECSGCMGCIEQCPVENTLTFDIPKGSFPLSERMLALGVVGLWALFIGMAMLSGHWETSIPMDMYKMLIPLADRF